MPLPLDRALIVIAAVPGAGLPRAAGPMNGGEIAAGVGQPRRAEAAGLQRAAGAPLNVAI